MHRLGERVYAETGFYWANVGAAVTDRGVILIDCPVRPSDSRRWQRELGALSPQGIRYLVLTDYHGDHTTGAAFVGEVVSITSRYAYDMLTKTKENHRFAKQNFINALEELGHADEAAEIANTPVPLPQVCFEDELRLHLPPLTFEIRRLGGHTPACSIVHIPEEGVVFSGDVLIDEPCPGLRDASVLEWLRAIEWVEGLPVDRIVPGHGEVCGKNGLRRLKSYLTGLWERMEDIVRTGRTQEEAVEDTAFDPFFWADPSRGNHWAEHRKYTFRRGLERLYEEVGKNHRKTG